jgi:class 3 adenylate cyclase
LKNDLGDPQAIALIRRHHSLVRTLLADFPESEEIERAGDSFFLVFAKPSDAVKFAVIFQARLRELARPGSPSVLDRIGIHVGEVMVHPLEICEVGEDGRLPLRPPPDSEKVRRCRDGNLTAS